MRGAGANRYVCHQCGYKFTVQSSLTAHQQSKHEGVCYSCNECDFIVTHKKHLTTHKQYKNEGVCYGCDQCNFKATHKDNLKIHKQSNMKVSNMIVTNVTIK